MIIALNIFLGVVAAILCMGVICEHDKTKNKNLTIAFVAVLAFIAVMNAFLK